MMAAGVDVRVLMEPGARYVRRLGDGQPMPAADHLITFVPARGDGARVLRRVATDVSITEVVTRANCNVATSTRAGRSLRASRSVRNRRTIPTVRLRGRHAYICTGCEFVPLVFTSLGRMYERTEKWLKLDDMAPDELLLQRICGGRRQFVARVLDGVSCALARGIYNALILIFVCAELARAKLRASCSEHRQAGRGDWEGLAPDRGLSRAGPM
jgi:hypothetical protein